MLTHIVLWRLSDTSKASELVEMLRGLEAKIDELKSINVGVNIIESDRAYDMGQVTVFDDEAGLRAYQQHPDHVAVAQQLRQYVTESASVDFVT